MSDAKRLILFDIDGTLLHPGGVGRAAIRAAMLEIFGTANGIDGHRFAGNALDSWRRLGISQDRYYLLLSLRLFCHLSK